MNPQSHLLYLLSIIIGLALTHVLQTVHRLWMASDRHRGHGLTYLWMAVIFGMTIEYWWVIFELDETWEHFGMFAFHLLAPLLLFLASAAITPEWSDGAWDETTLDLEALYYEKHRYVFGLVAAFMAHAIVQAALIGTRAGTTPPPPSSIDAWTTASQLGRFGGLTMALVLAATSNRLVHRVVSAVWALLFAGYLVFVRMYVV